MRDLTNLDLDNNCVERIDSLSRLTKLTRLKLENNKIESIEALKNLTQIRYLYLSRNRIENIGSLANLTKLRLLFLSQNRVRFLEPIRTQTLMKYLFLDHNELSRILNVIGSFKDLEKLKISSNRANLTHYNSSWLSLFPYMSQVYFDRDMLSLFQQNGERFRRNERVVRTKNRYTFYKSLFLITDDDLEACDCRLTLDYMKRRIHLNLFYYRQTDLFLDKCRHSLDSDEF